MAEMASGTHQLKGYGVKHFHAFFFFFSEGQILKSEVERPFSFENGIKKFSKPQPS